MFSKQKNNTQLKVSTCWLHLDRLQNSLVFETWFKFNAQIFFFLNGTNSIIEQSDNF